MANKRVSELNELSAVNLKADDLFLVTDTAISVLESKKIRASSLKDYVLDNGNITATVSHALLADTASYLLYTGTPNGTASFAISASYAKSSSWSDRGFWSKYSDTCSYISAAYIDGTLPSSINSQTASYVLYQYGNGTVENSKTASYCDQSNTSSYLWYVPGIDNGIASYSITASSCNTSSYLRYTGVGNGTSSYSMISKYSKDGDHALVSDTAGSSIFASLSETASYAKTSSLSNTASFLYYHAALNPRNGTASYAIKSDNSIQSLTASYLRYNGTDNGTSFNSIFATNATTAAYAALANTASYAKTSSLSDTASYTKSSSYSIVAETVNDVNIYRTYGPYVADSQTTGLAYSQIFVLNTNTGAGKTTIIQAIGDVKVPITQTETNPTVALYLEYLDPMNTWSLDLDSSNVSNYINLSLSGAFTLSGYNKQGFSLGGSYSLSGSWYRIGIRTANGALIDTRAVKFFIHTKADSITKI